MKGIAIGLSNTSKEILKRLKKTEFIDEIYIASSKYKMKSEENKVWCFVGDMTFESGLFYETYKYARNFGLPLEFVVEDNGLSTNTPSEEAWGGKQTPPADVFYYQYERTYPHHGTGNWVLF